MPRPLRIVISGYRHYEDWYYLKHVLDGFNIEEIIVGDATGADEMARKYSREVLGKEPIVEYANWGLFGNSAGPIRNGKLLDHEPDLLIAFKHPRSRGTVNMINQAKARRISVIVLNV